MFKRLKKKRFSEITQKINLENIEKRCDSANFYGQKSRGVCQIRGNGVLVVTTEYLVFKMWFPKRFFRIPRNQIQSAEKAKGFLGKYRGGKPVLLIRFHNDEGNEDQIAWLVPELESWLHLFPTRSSNH